jgi:hypothetical protein
MLRIEKTQLLSWVVINVSSIAIAMQEEKPEKILFRTVFFLRKKQCVSRLSNDKKTIFSMWRLYVQKTKVLIITSFFSPRINQILNTPIAFYFDHLERICTTMSKLSLVKKIIRCPNRCQSPIY